MPSRNRRISLETVLNNGSVGASFTTIGDFGNGPCHFIKKAFSPMIHSRSLRQACALVFLAGVYFLAGKAGLGFASILASASPVWPAAGIALAAFLICGFRVWPAILVGAFLVNVTTAGTVLTSAGIAIGNTLEGLLGAYLIVKFAQGLKAFNRAQDVLKFALIAGIVSTTVSPTIGIVSLSLGGFANWADFGSIWLTWWLGDGVGNLVVAPLVILWFTDRRVKWSSAQKLELSILVLCLVLVGDGLFGGAFHGQIKNYPLEFVCTPFLIWAAIRFTQREAVTALTLLSGVAIWGTLRGFGPFVSGTPNTSLLLLQTFIGVVTVMTMALAAEFSERRRIEAQVRCLAVSDPLTGLANYRCLMDTLDAEARRFERTGRPFAVLLLDVDHFKSINDSLGHQAGNRALCHLADVLRIHCRATDTAARYGGDEFALVLPETEANGAERLQRRISAFLGNECGELRLSVSIGIAVFPDDGRTIAELLTTVDEALYGAKRCWVAQEFRPLT
jgi:diguanylate cyclase (GGDEF)-like protein